MSYNIVSFVPKTLDKFRFNLAPAVATFCDCDVAAGDDIELADAVMVMLLRPFTIRVEGRCELSHVQGVLTGEDNDSLLVTEIDWSGLGSGVEWRLLESLFENNSAGLLVALVVWEDGSVEKLTVQDGRISRQGVDV